MPSGQRGAASASGSGDAHLEEVALGDEPGAGGACVGVGIGVGAVHPVGDVTAAVAATSVERRRASSASQVDGGVGEDDELDRPLVVVVTREVRVRVAPDSSKSAAVAARQSRACPVHASSPSGHDAGARPRPRRRARGRAATSAAAKSRSTGREPIGGG